MNEFTKDRKGALLSMDEEAIRAFFKKYNGSDMPQDMNIFWIAVHAARTGDQTLPMFERAASKHWLLDRGLPAMDYGEVFPPTESMTELKKYFQRLKDFGCD